MLGMPRRIYTYDAGQGWEAFNMVSTIGVGFLIVSTLIFFHNFFWSRKRGAVSGSNPWDAATLEWSIPSPPPDYNFARIPTVTSRYPLWDVTHPELTANIPHTEEGDRHIEVDLVGREVADVRVHSMAPSHTPSEMATTAEHNLREGSTARQLGIPMPAPTIKPLLVGLCLVLMISGMLFMHRESKVLALTIMLGFGGGMVFFLYNWLLSPLED
jgi:cytochrome c oxidase subunit 1